MKQIVHIKPLDASQPFKLSVLAIFKNHGHPWYGHQNPNESWDLIEVRCTKESEVDNVEKKLEAKFWKTWIRDNTGGLSMVMYKPSGLMSEWDDCPKIGLTILNEQGKLNVRR